MNPIALTGCIALVTGSSTGVVIDLGKHGIQVNALGPGYCKTGLTHALVDDPSFSARLADAATSFRPGIIRP